MPVEPVIGVYRHDNGLFCYALYGRLRNDAGDFEISWMAEQHLRFLESSFTSFQEQAPPTARVASARKRFADVRMSTTLARPNTKPVRLFMSAALALLALTLRVDSALCGASEAGHDCEKVA